MKILDYSDLVVVKTRLSDLDQTVKLINFTQEFECQYCRETRWMLEDLSSLSGKLSLGDLQFSAGSRESWPIQD
jgi:hypothetical protein